jgi:Domain of unknown function DUF29
MAPRNKDHHTPLAPEAPVRTDYARDPYTWSQEQARLIRDGRWDAIDRENVAEEIESVGRTEFSRLVSALRVLMLHMLKWSHQPERRTRSWVLSIKAQRNELDDLLSDNPGLRPRIPDAMKRAYRNASTEAALETGLDENTFPASCPYSFDDVMARQFSL